MQYALAADGVEIEAAPDLVGACELCGKPVRTKCGDINIWHWYHLDAGDCDKWAEPDSEWHRAWQRSVPRSQREVPMPPHRADIVTRDGIVVELQHSALAPAKIAEREAFYGEMAWLFNATDAVTSNRLIVRSHLGQHGPYATFQWKYPRRSVSACLRPVALDLGQDRILHVRKMIYDATPWQGWGYLWSREMILSWVLGNVSLDWCAFRTKVPHAARQATTCSQAQSNRHMDVTMSVLS